MGPHWDALGVSLVVGGSLQSQCRFPVGTPTGPLEEALPCGCRSWPVPWLCPIAQTRLWSSFRQHGWDVPRDSACGARLGHCSAGPGLHPAAAEHPYLPPAGESPALLPVGPCARPCAVSPTTPSSPQTICACRRKTRGKLDLFSTKDSYHPMSEYLQYQSHGRYVSPSSKPNPYSQVSAQHRRHPAAPWPLVNG